MQTPTAIGLMFAAVYAPLALAAPPAITSTPSVAARLNEPYRYDADGLPQASGDGPIDWTLAAAPAGMEIDNLTGEIFWFTPATGSFPVALVATNGEGSDRQDFTIQVTGPNPPAIAPVQVQQVTRGVPVSLQLFATGAQPIVWRLDSGPAGARMDPVAGRLSWLPATAGTEVFTFSAANSTGQDTASWTVDVVNVTLPSPSASFTAAPSTAEVPAIVSFDATASTANHPSDPLLLHRWDFGDGSPTRTGVLPALSHGYPQPGGYVVRLTVENLYLQSAVAAVPVLVTAGGVVPPRAAIEMDVASGSVPLAVTFRCDCHAGDQPIVGYEWQFGDGEGSTQAEVAHAFSRPGGYNVKLRVLDAAGRSAQDSRYLGVGEGAKLPPFARARAVPVSGDAPLNVQLVSEFGDRDGVVVSRRWTLPDGRSAVDADPSWVLDKVGTVLARLEVVDDDGLISADTVELQVTRNGAVPPRILSSPATVGAVGIPYRYDADGRPTAQGGLPLQWELASPVEGMTVNADTGQITWTPRKSQVGEVRVSLSASNAAGTSVQDFTVSVVDRFGFYLVGCAAAAPGVPLAGLAVALAALALRNRRR